MNSCVKSLRSKNKDKGFNLSCALIFYFWKKNLIKINGQNHHKEDKKEGQKKTNRRVAHKNQRRERANFFCVRKIFHPQPF